MNPMVPRESNLKHTPEHREGRVVLVTRAPDTPHLLEDCGNMHNRSLGMGFTCPRAHVHKGAMPMFHSNNFKHWLFALVFSVGVVAVLAYPCDSSTKAHGEIPAGPRRLWLQNTQHKRCN